MSEIWLIVALASVGALFALIGFAAGRRANLNEMLVEDEPAGAVHIPPQAPSSVADEAMARDLALAQAVQARMSPKGVVRVPGFAVTGDNQMADACGGDWWSCHLLPDGRLLLAVGDVTGHGLAAALVAVMARGVVEGVVRSLGEAASPTRVIATLSASIDELGSGHHGMTCCVAVLDPFNGELDLASAGHPFPLVRRCATGLLEVVAARGSPLGSGPSKIGTASAQLNLGDLLVLCSDGLTDRAGADGRRFGERRLRKLLSEHAPDPVETGVFKISVDILTAVDGFAASTDADDDLTLVMCEYRERVGRAPEVGAAPISMIPLDKRTVVLPAESDTPTLRMFQWVDPHRSSPTRGEVVRSKAAANAGETELVRTDQVHGMLLEPSGREAGSD